MADQQQDPVFQIQRVYLKEASLEQPNSPGILLEQEQPSVDIQLGVEATQAADGVYEICVTATVTTKVKDKTVFLVEAKQAGIFEIRNIPAEQVQQIVGIACPGIVYPYLRNGMYTVTVMCVNDLIFAEGVFSLFVPPFCFSVICRIKS